jgi:hypothetical protein
MLLVYLMTMMVPILPLSISKASAGFMKDRLGSLQPAIEKTRVAVPVGVARYLLFVYCFAYVRTAT